MAAELAAARAASRRAYAAGWALVPPADPGPPSPGGGMGGDGVCVCGDADDRGGAEEAEGSSGERERGAAAAEALRRLVRACREWSPGPGWAGMFPGPASHADRLTAAATALGLGADEPMRARGEGVGPQGGEKERTASRCCFRGCSTRRAPADEVAGLQAQACRCR
jgi:hypothetical protein